MSEIQFVGRKDEWARLQASLDLALAGQGQIVFVTGEAGSGKSTLVTTFAQQMQEEHPDLLVATGACNAQGGLGDPYLPFRQILTTLTGASESETAAPTTNSERLRKMAGHSAQILLEIGPDLVGAIVPGASLIGSLGKAVAHQAGWTDKLDKLTHHKHAASVSGAAADPERIFEQYARVLVALAKEHPLLLILDDLHWADDASVSLLFHLSRRILSSRILLIGTYRADEMQAHAEGRSLLAKTLSEIKRYVGAAPIDLDALEPSASRAFVDELLDREPNSLDAAFRESLYQQTSGHPLFTVELVHMLKARGHLVQDEAARWTAAPDLDWNTLPARVEGVIEERLGRLSPSERELLRSASVQGYDFAAEIVAAVQNMPLRAAVQELSQNLGKRHRLVEEKEEAQPGPIHLSPYRFVHVLFQRYLYNETGRSERRLLHAEVARAMEQLYESHAEQVCAELAYHFEQAGNADKAVTYLLQAGHRANLQGAARQACDFFDRALALLPQSDRERRWNALLGRSDALARLGDRQAHHASVTALLASAEESDDRLALAHSRHGFFLDTRGEYHAALAAYETALAAAWRAGSHELGTAILAIKVIAQHRLGDREGAAATAEEILSRAQGVDETTRSQAMMNLAVYFVESGNLERAALVHREQAEARGRLGDRHAEANALGNLGYDLICLGLYDSGRATLERALHLHEKVGANRQAVYVRLNLGLVYWRLNRPRIARQILEPLQPELAALGDDFASGAGLNYLGLVCEQTSDWTRGAECFLRARDLLRQVGAPGFCADASAGLARCAWAAGAPEDAREHVQAVWEYLQDHEGGAGMELPLKAFVTCAEILHKLEEIELARRAIETGYHVLEERAGRISQPEWRAAFLDNVAEHRSLERLHKGLSEN